MPVPGFAHGVTSASYWMSHLRDAQTRTAAKTDATQSASQTADAHAGDGFWGDVLDVVNPLQHLPVVGTIYRAATGDKIGDVEKVAGDTLYGGPIGLVSSLADLAFEKVTGKNFGDTVMAFVGLDGNSDKTTALADNTQQETPKTPAATPLQTQIATAAPVQLANVKPRIVPSASPALAPAKVADSKTTPPSVVDISANTDALLQALARNGVTGDMQAQALNAYKRTMQMNAAPIAPATH